MSLILIPDSPEGQSIRRWLTYLDEYDKGGRAQLRRASSVLDAVMCPAVHRLRQQLEELRSTSINDQLLDRLAIACALMANLKQPTGRLAVPLAMSERAAGSDRNAVSELRFRRLLDAHNDEALFTGLRRALPLIDGLVCPIQLAGDVVFWGDKVKRAWAYAYYRWPN
ncbi:type I-E CRISPR-associated protein Cse2/CasB [Pigmentiphaga sp. NML080357]|uniref:type I-E CRISPR-associated protein Cse2/CasB n=1 Tax=Pigmentiphaga sp. NML080357 TaxID=2008675 RepID=UPI000B41D006|nr:type I-E CRISPR-associated protein Cse2/CasB [Pigmentiphaga sp. NML080357]OVZ59073.1 type I-E CRISPR-associated protein Cse2/CasB [Pigmentiphaga sp. NML080357]